MGRPSEQSAVNRAGPDRRGLGWCFIAFYVVAIYLSLPLVRPIINALRNAGLQWIYAQGLPGLGAVAGLLLLRRIVGSRRPGRARAVLALAALAALYTFLLQTLATYPAERVHLIQYGLLGYLAGMRLSASGRLPGWVVGLSSASLATTVGFVDEAIQGVLPMRYFDVRDIAVNAVSGAMGLAVVAILRPFRAEPAGPGPMPGAWRAPVLASAVALAAVGAGMFLVTRPPLDPSVLAGAWARVNVAGVCQCYRFDGVGRMAWADGEGNRAEGRYALVGNRLDGPMLEFVVEDGCPSDGPGWLVDQKLAGYCRVEPHAWRFTRYPWNPYFRVGPAGAETTGGGHVARSRSIQLDCCNRLLR